MDQVFQVIGAVLILAAFGLAQVGRLGVQSYGYLLLNLIGSAILAVLAFDRGATENWIKDLKNALQADRLSDCRFWANAFRLLLHAAAPWLLDTPRH